MKSFFPTAALVATLLLLGEASAINATTLKSNIMDQVNNMVMAAPRVFQDETKSKSGSPYVNCKQGASGLYTCTTGPGVYGNNERATIELRGPGKLTFTSIDTEKHYDTVRVGGTEEIRRSGWSTNSGKLVGCQTYTGATQWERWVGANKVGCLIYTGANSKMPPVRSIPAGQTVDVVWRSDGSVIGKGWTFTFASTASASDTPGSCSACAPGKCTHNCPYVSRLACSKGQTKSCTPRLSADEKNKLAWSEGYTNVARTEGSYESFEQHEMRWGWPLSCEQKEGTGGTLLGFGANCDTVASSWSKTTGAKSRQDSCCTGLWDMKTPATGPKAKDTAPGLCAALGCDVDTKEAMYKFCNSQPCTNKAGKALVQPTPFMKYTNSGEDKMPTSFQDANKANCCSVAGRCARWGCKIPNVDGKTYKEIQTACDSIYPTCRNLFADNHNQLDWVFARID